MEDLTPTELYALLCAVGCPRLAFLLTNLEPRDPLDEELATRKRWLTQPLKGERGGAPHLAAGSEGFLVHVSYLEPLEEEVVEGWTGSGAELDAMIAVDRELAKLIGLAERGFEGPEMEGSFDRYVDRLAELKGWYEDAVVAGRDCSEEELREWHALGVGKLYRTLDSSPALRVKVREASEMPEGLREKLGRKWEPFLLDSLRESRRCWRSPATRA